MLMEYAILPSEAFMELRVLTYFLMVAREENITKASQLLHVTQPTLSRQLMQLEDELGVKLFQRGSHKVSLTEDGMLLKRRAQDIVSLAEKTMREFQSAEDDLTGDISIGGGELLSIDYFASILSAFQRRNPNVHYTIRTGTADDIKNRIESGLIDIGILIAPGDISKYESVHLPRTEEYGVLVKDDSPLAQKEAVTSEDLKNVPLMFATRSKESNFFSSWFGSYYDSLNITATFNLSYNAAIMVKNDIGVAMGIRLNMKIDGVSFVPLMPSIKGDSYFVWKKNETLSPATRAFIEFARNRIKCST